MIWAIGMPMDRHATPNYLASIQQIVGVEIQAGGVGLLGWWTKISPM